MYMYMYVYVYIYIYIYIYIYLSPNRRLCSRASGLETSWCAEYGVVCPAGELQGAFMFEHT